MKVSKKSQILLTVADEILKNQQNIIQANQIDLDFAQKNNLEAAKIDRLKLTKERIEAIANSVIEIANLEDPVGKILEETTNSNNGLNIKKVTTPIGRILVIYEARPNVTSDVAALCLKSGNKAILKTGKESFHSSKIIANIYRKILKNFGMDQDIINFVEDVSRESVKKLLKNNKEIDLVIPRGGRNLIEFVAKNTRIPILKHLDGNCHCYIENSADITKALKIIYNAKMRRVGICGATESLVIDKKIANQILPLIVDNLSKVGCEIRGDSKAIKICSQIQKASRKDFQTEYLDKIISVKIVQNIDEAIEHINKFGSQHTDCIITEDSKKAQKFFNEIDSAIVMQNTSTQFADGGEFGLGAEIGISTGKLHARGPVGVGGLVTYKYIVNSDGAVRV